MKEKPKAQLKANSPPQTIFLSQKPHSLFFLSFFFRLGAPFLSLVDIHTWFLLVGLSFFFPDFARIESHTFMYNHKDSAASFPCLPARFIGAAAFYVSFSLSHFLFMSLIDGTWEDGTK